MWVRPILVLATATLVAACGSASTSTALHSPTVSSLLLESPTALQTPSPTPSPMPSSTPVAGGGQASPAPLPSPIADSPIPTSGGWVTFANHAGQFTFSAPADWGVLSCEDVSDYAVAIHNPPYVCGRGEYEDAWLSLLSESGDQRQQLPPACGSAFNRTVTGTTTVVVDSVQGDRYSAVVVQSTGLPPPVGSHEVCYVFFNGNRTYALIYDHWPTDPDRTADFDRLVQQTLRFSA